jgi:Fic family protein
MSARTSGGIYHKVQVELTYNSNHMEGSRLTHDQTCLIFETAMIGPEGEGVRVDDVIEASNTFRCIDHIIDHAGDALSEPLLKDLHRILKTSTGDADRDWVAVGDYKRLPNEVGGRETTAPEDVAREVRGLISSYEVNRAPTLEYIVSFHVLFERIHPFQDGNGRVGRLVMFKECLRHGITPFVITDDAKLFYYRGLSRWDSERGWLMDTCLSAQDTFKGWLDYFRIPYVD